MSGHLNPGGHLDPGGQQFRGDRGVADPRVTAALAAYQAGLGSEQAALTALAAARLLVPVVAVLTDGTATQGDKDSEMMLPTLIGRDGRAAVIAFTSLDALARWRPEARPVPAEADRVWRAAVADGCAAASRSSSPGDHKVSYEKVALGKGPAVVTVRAPSRSLAQARKACTRNRVLHNALGSGACFAG